MIAILYKRIVIWVILLCSFSFYAWPKDLIIHKTMPTLLSIMKIIVEHKKGMYLRFGDGDVQLACGGNDCLQKKNPSITQEMRQAFALHGPTIIKSLPLHCKELNSYEKGMFDGNQEQSLQWCNKLLKKIEPYWQPHLDHIYSPVALHFTAAHHPERCILFLTFLKQVGCALLVGNENIPSEIKNLLFGSECKHIRTPPKNAYKDIDRIERECLAAMQGQTKYTIIVTAMGCSGRVLQKRLWSKLDNVFLFDFGSLLDALCGWDTRGWIGLTNFNARDFLLALCKTHDMELSPALLPDTLKRMYYTLK